MMALSFKLGPKESRDAIAALSPLVPWWARERLESLMDSKLGVQFTADIIRKKHSDAQRGYYHMCVGLLAKHVGMTHDELHDEVLKEAFGTREVQLGERIVSLPAKRSANLPIGEYSELIETVLRTAAFCGYALPSPEDVA